MSTRINAPQCDLSRPDFDALVLSANQGNAEALKRLREVLDDSPSLWQSIANLGGHCELLLVSLIAGGNSLLRESLSRQVASIKDELGSGGPGVLQEIAIQRFVNAWLLMSHVNAVCPAPESRAEVQRQEAAHRQYDQAVKGLKAVARGVPREVLPRPLRVVG